MIPLVRFGGFGNSGIQSKFIQEWNLIIIQREKDEGSGEKDEGSGEEIWELVKKYDSTGRVQGNQGIQGVVSREC